MGATAKHDGFRDRSADSVDRRSWHRAALALPLLAATASAAAGGEPAAKICAAAPGIRADVGKIPGAEGESGAATRSDPTPDQIAQAERLVKRGDAFLAQGDIAVARQYFVRAADLGHAVAAFRMAETYDANELARRNARGVVADAAETQRWYERARTLLLDSGGVRLSRLGCPDEPSARAGDRSKADDTARDSARRDDPD
jgi:hypothetical protein